MTTGLECKIEPFDGEFPNGSYPCPAYRTGYEGVMKYAGRDYAQVETDLALDYQKHDPKKTALPWDRARQERSPRATLIAAFAAIRSPAGRYVAEAATLR